MRMTLVYCALMLGGSAAAQAPAVPVPPKPKLDLASKMINVPNANWTIYGPGQTNTRLETGGPQGYPAFRVTVTKAGAHAWDVGALSPVPKPVGAGDVILVAIYLRAPSLQDGQTLSLPMIGATGAKPPYASIAQAPVQITNQWKAYFASGKAPSSFAAGEVQLTAHLAGAPHVVELGPVKVYDLGSTFDINSLPHN